MERFFQCLLCEALSPLTSPARCAHCGGESGSVVEGAGAPRSEPDFTIGTSRRRYRLFAPFYDVVFGPGLQHGRRVAIEALDCRAGERVLEVCIGTGLSLPLYPPGVHVTGIDASREMLKKAASRVRARGSARPAALAQMDAEHLAFADATFDKAAILFAIAGLPDPVRAMKEIRRVCRPDATIVVANHFQCSGAFGRACNTLLAPLHELLRYRSELDLHWFVSVAGVDVLEALPANLNGHSTVLVCRNRA